MTKFIHPVAGILAVALISTFWLSTVFVELLGTQPQVIAVKTTIPWGFLVLVPALAVTGATGFSRAKGRRGGVLGAKARRMPFIAANGALVLLPAGLFLAARAHAQVFDLWFYGVQAIELVFGAGNLALMGLSLKDGLRLTGRLRQRTKQHGG